MKVSFLGETEYKKEPLKTRRNGEVLTLEGTGKSTEILREKYSKCSEFEMSQKLGSNPGPGEWGAGRDEVSA